jgi:pimeloyl-ACP methyl ester carboxylesterase
LNELLRPWVDGCRVIEVDTAGTRVQWLVSDGDGPPLVLLHGDFGAWLHWMRNLAELGRHYRLYVPDMPGFGGSATLSDNFDESRVAAVLAGHLRQLIPAASYRLAGFSLGAIVAGHLAAHEGLRVSHLVVCGPGGLGINRSGPGPRLERTPPGADFSVVAPAQRRNLAKLMIADPARIDELAVRAHVENIGHTRTRASRIPSTTSLIDVLPDVTATLGAIWGEHDHYCDPAMIALSEQALRRIHPGLNFRQLPAAGHWAPYEQPELFDAALLNMMQTL